ncbi:MAG: hypothetical protein WC979_05395 [Candidatus Pacearchaeota archaeon]|jgi:hypothetical protein
MNIETIDEIAKKHSKRRLTRARAIKLYCKEMCCAGDLKSWRNCSFYNCFLWQFRLGRETLGKPSSFNKNTAKHRGFFKKKPIVETKEEIISQTVKPEIKIDDKQTKLEVIKNG